MGAPAIIARRTLLPRFSVPKGLVQDGGDRDDSTCNSRGLYPMMPGKMPTTREYPRNTKTIAKETKYSGLPMIRSKNTALSSWITLTCAFGCIFANQLLLSDLPDHR